MREKIRCKKNITEKLKMKNICVEKFILCRKKDQIFAHVKMSGNLMLEEKKKIGPQFYEIDNFDDRKIINMNF